MPKDLQLAPSVVLTETRRQELSRAIDKIRKRLDDNDWTELKKILHRVANSSKRRACPEAILQFDGDSSISLDQEPEQETEAFIEVRQTSTWPNLSAQNAREP